MRIGILGAGNMADALGRQWVRAGHQVMVSGREPGKTATAAGRFGAAPGTWQEAVGFGDVVLLAVTAQGVPAVLEAVGSSLRDKLLIDCTNPIVPGRFVLTGALAERVAETTGARVVKAFNLCHHNVWRMVPPVFDGTPLAVPLCGDDEAALQAARSLVADVGATPVNGGGLERAHLLEATAAFVIGLWSAGADPQAVVPPLRLAFGGN